MNDADRLTRWVREHGQAVFGFLSVRLRDRQQAEDLVQDVFLRAWQARERYAEAGHERAYLLRIADHLACDRLRRPTRERDVADEAWPGLEPADAGLPPDQRAIAEESSRALHEALETLSEPQRRALLLRYYGQLEFTEIAAALGCPVNTALSYAHRGLAALRRLLLER